MRLTRSGWWLLVVGVATVMLARTLQVRQIWMIGASLVVAVLVALLAVARRTDGLVVTRQVEPAELHVGIAARLVVDVHNSTRHRLPGIVVASGTTSWRLPSLPSNTSLRMSQVLSTHRRGVVSLPAVEMHRVDAMGLARRSTAGCDTADVVVSARTVPLTMVQMGVGALGSQLTQRARHFGVGEFEGLRHYVEGDDLRLVHWKASARSTDLLVKQFSMEGARRCTVVLDTSTPCTTDEFETGVSIAASLVEAAYDAGLSIRLATTGGVDLWGGSSPTSLRRALAELTHGSPMVLPGRDPADGLGLMICISPTVDSEPWMRRDQFTDPAMVSVVVSLRGEVAGNATDGSSLEAFAQSWHRLVTANPASGTMT